MPIFLKKLAEFWGEPIIDTKSLSFSSNAPLGINTDVYKRQALLFFISLVPRFIKTDGNPKLRYGELWVANSFALCAQLFFCYEQKKD